MMKHIVMWRLKDEAAGATKEENALKLKDSLESLTDKIPSLKETSIVIAEEDPADKSIWLITQSSLLIHFLADFLVLLFPSCRNT